MVLNVGPPSLATLGYTDFGVRLNGVAVGTVRLAETGIRTVRWPLPAGPPGTVEVEFQANPAFHEAAADSRTLGVAIVSFGFLPTGR